MNKKELSDKLNKLKMESAEELGLTQFVKENNDHYKGDVSAKTNGSQGGPIGGRMVQKMIKSEQDKLSGGNGAQ